MSNVGGGLEADREQEKRRQALIVDGIISRADPALGMMLCCEFRALCRLMGVTDEEILEEGEEQGVCYKVVYDTFFF